MGEEVNKAIGPGHKGSPGPCSEKPLGKGVEQPNSHFERLPVCWVDRKLGMAAGPRLRQGLGYEVLVT